MTARTAAEQAASSRAATTEPIAELERLYARKRAAGKRPKEVAATGTSLVDLRGVRPFGLHGCCSRSATSRGSSAATTSTTSASDRRSNPTRPSAVGTVVSRGRQASKVVVGS